MKKRMFKRIRGGVCFFIVFLGIIPALGASDFSLRFNQMYESLRPPPNSSVHSDYLFQQMALGSSYTVRLLDRIYDQNRRMEKIYDRILEKYDRIEAQNDEIILLLERLVEQP